ncbi:MAG: hypothetical protein ACOCR6_01425 [archaeon]
MTDSETERRSRRRFALLLLVGLLVLFGAGIGGITLFDSGVTPTDDNTSTTASPPDPSTTTVKTPSTQTTPSATTVDTDDETGTPRGDGGTPDDRATVSLDTPGDATIMAIGDVVPGDAGTNRLVLENTGRESGTLRIAETTVVDHENGIVEAEAAVDDSPDEGELSDAITVRMRFRYSDGEDAIVVGSNSSFVPLASMNATAPPEQMVAPGERVIVEIEWRIDQTAGNEIQSDSTTFDVVFELSSVDS